MAKIEEEEIEYVAEPPPQGEMYKEFAHIFQKYSQLGNQPKQEQDQESGENANSSMALVSREEMQDENVDGRVQETGVKKENDGAIDRKPSKRKVKEMTRMSVAGLKQAVARPELVELHDVTASDPVFLLHLKSIKNSVPVPRHWSSKRKYLQGKRGYEKPPFQLPEFIRQTGIMEMRDSIQDKDSGKSLKSKQRERVQPKMGKIQMEYGQLHDAFFKWQTKPRLCIHGDLYYEGKEFERKFKYKPGELSSDLRKALGLPTGANAHRYPPPWLSAMKRAGPPPSYPYLKIPGFNCPFSDGTDLNHDDDDNNLGGDGGDTFENETNMSDGGGDDDDEDNS